MENSGFLRPGFRGPGFERVLYVLLLEHKAMALVDRGYALHRIHEPRCIACVSVFQLRELERLSF